MRFDHPLERCVLHQANEPYAVFRVAYDIVPRLAPKDRVYFTVEEYRYNFIVKEDCHTTIAVKPTYNEASKVLQKKVAGLIKQGYKIDSEKNFAYIPATKKAQKVLLPDVLQLLREKYPVGAILESPTGKRGVIIHMDYDGSIQVRLDNGDVIISPFGQYQQMKVI